MKTNTWKKEDNKFKAGFKLNGQTMSAAITTAGELVETETDIALAKLATDYKAYKVTDAATLVAADGTTTYEAGTSKGSKH